MKTDESLNPKPSAQAGSAFSLRVTHIFTIDFEDIAKEKFEDLGEFAQIDDWYVKCMLQATIAAWTK